MFFCKFAAFFCCSVSVFADFVFVSRQEPSASVQTASRQSHSEVHVCQSAALFLKVCDFKRSSGQYQHFCLFFSLFFNQSWSSFPSETIKHKFAGAVSVLTALAAAAAAVGCLGGPPEKEKKKKHNLSPFGGKWPSFSLAWRSRGAGGRTCLKEATVPASAASRLLKQRPSGYLKEGAFYRRPLIPTLLVRWGSLVQWVEKGLIYLGFPN